MFVVNEGQSAILLQFGRIVADRLQAGPAFQAAASMQQVMRFDKRILTLESAPERYLTSEKKDVNVDFYVKWRIVDAAKFYVVGRRRRDARAAAPRRRS